MIFGRKQSLRCQLEDVRNPRFPDSCGPVGDIVLMHEL